MPDFGLSAALAAGLTGAGIGAETAAAASPFIVGGLEGAALGAGETLFTGGDPLTGALTGGLTGGAIGGLGPEIGAATGIGTTGGDIVAGAGAGAIGSAITGGDPITGALTGGAGGAVSGIFGGATGSGGEAAATGATASVTPTAGAVGTGGGPSAAGTTTGISVPAAGAGSGAAPVDLTSGLTDPNGNPFGAPSAGQTFGVSGSGSTTLGDFSPRPETSGIGKIGSNVMGLIEKNPGVLLAGGLLGANLLMGDNPSAAEKQLTQQAGEAGSVGRTLAAFQQSGTLPAGLQAVVDQQIDAAKASLVSQYGELGLGSSTMLSDKLNQLKQQRSAEIATFADQLGRQGVQWSQLSAQELGQLLTTQTQRDNAFTSALGSFASGLSGLRTGSAA